MNIEAIEDELDNLFDTAIGVTDTIWYSKTETPRDAIINMLCENMRPSDFI